MSKGPLLCCLGACLVLLACPSGPSSSGPDRASDQEQAEALQRKIEVVEDLMARRPLAARVWDDLSSALPDRVWLIEVVYDSEGVRIKGRARTNNLLADYVSRLEARPGLTQVMLVSSVQKRARGFEFQEFALRASVADAGRENPAAPGAGTGSGSTAALAARLEELEKGLQERKETADLLRKVQQLAYDSSLNVTKFAPGNEVQKEFYGEWPVVIEVTGTRQALGRFFGRMADLPGLWLISNFSVKAVSGEDARSPVRASITAQTFLPGENPTLQPVSRGFRRPGN
jgi:hypothetical protein